MARKGIEYVEYIEVWDSTTGLQKTGDSANITMYIDKDGGGASATTNSVSEVDGTNMPGVYKITLTATEMNANSIALAGTSSTANVVVGSAFISTEDIKGDTVQLLSDLAVVDGIVDSIQTDTTDILADLAVVDGIVDSIQTDTTDILADLVTIESKVDTVDTVVDSIQTDTTDILADLAVVDSNIDMIVAKLPAGTISDFDLDDVIDGAKVRTIFGLMKANVTNKYLVNTPTIGDITFYQDDGVSVLAIVHLDTTGRTKISFVNL